MESLHQVKLNLSPLQIKKLAKKQVVQIKPDQLDNGVIFVSLDKKHHSRFKRAKKNKTGFRIQMNDHMIQGSGFSDILNGLKTGAQKLASVAVPYVKDKLKSLLPGVRSDIDAGLNSGVNFVADKLKSGLSPILGNDLANDLVNKGAASVKGFAKDKLDQLSSTLNGMGLKRTHHYKMYGGKLSINLSKIADVIKPVAKLAVPLVADAFGGPAAGVVASVATDAMLGNGVPPRLYLGRPGASDEDKKRLAGKGLKAMPKKAVAKKKKINGAALMPMGKGRGGALFPM